MAELDVLFHVPYKKIVLSFSSKNVYNIFEVIYYKRKNYNNKIETKRLRKSIHLKNRTAY
jgi:hypothetical protein